MATKKGSPSKRGPGSSTKIGKVAANRAKASKTKAPRGKKSTEEDDTLAGPGSVTKIGGEGEDEKAKQYQPRRPGKTKLSGPGSGGPKLGGRGGAKKKR